jgi:hypothetical protein
MIKTGVNHTKYQKVMKLIRKIPEKSPISNQSVPVTIQSLVHLAFLLAQH